MSTSYGSAVIVGSSMSGLYRAEVKDAEKKQFDKDTGKAFMVPIKQLHGTFGSTRLPAVEFEKSEYSYRGAEARHNFDFLEEEGLKVHLPSWDGSGYANYVIEHGIVGISMCSGDRDDNGSCSIDAINKAADKVKKALAKFGYTGEILLYSQLSWG